MLKDQRDIIAAFNTHGVKYLVIGGQAVSIHADPRGTKDLDVFIKADEENSKAVFAALAEFGAPLGGMTPDDFNDKATTVFQLGVEPAGLTFCKESRELRSTKRGRVESRSSSMATLRRTSSRVST
jgi:hypothetical protein